MRWSQQTTKDGIVQEITFLTGLDTNAIATEDRARMANRWYQRAALLAWKNDPDWQFDDGENIAAGQSNNSWTYDSTFAGLPRATRDLTDDTRIYGLPTNAFAIERVEVKRANGDWVVVKPIEESKLKRGVSLPEFDAAIPEFLKTKGIPRYYNLIGTNIELFPAPDSSEITTTAGIKIYVSRNVYRFASTDDSKEPALPEQFHQILSLGASADIALAKGLENAKRLRDEAELMLFELGEYYSQRTRHNRRYIRPTTKHTI